MTLTAERVAVITAATPRRVAHAARRLGYDRWTPPSALAVCVAVALVDEHGRHGDYRAVRAPARACGDAWDSRDRPAFLIVAHEGFAVLCGDADFDLVMHVGEPFVVYRVVVLGPYVTQIETS